MWKCYTKGTKIIKSCKNQYHIDSATLFVKRFEKMFPDYKHNIANLYEMLYIKLIEIIKIKIDKFITENN